MSAKSNIQTMFEEVPGTYEKINHTLTLGLDRIWRKRMVKRVARHGGTLWLDVCTGTGETAVYLKTQGEDHVHVVALDFTFPMLKQALSKPEAASIDFCLADVKKMPFRDETFDVVTLSFATRNLNLNRDILKTTFEELYRVLKPGGLFFNLETSQPPNPLIRKLFHLVIRLTVFPLGSRVSGSATGYRYLSNTIQRFYEPSVLASILKEAGFATVSFRQWMLGAVALHQSQKTQTL